MNAAVTLGVKKVNGKPVYTIITDPNTPHRDQRKQFRVLRRKLHREFDEVQLWTSSSGRVKKQRTTAAALPTVGVVPVAPVAPKAETQPAEATVPAPETAVSDNSGGESTPTPVPDKKGAALAKARAAAAAKKAAKAAKSTVDPLS